MAAQTPNRPKKRRWFWITCLGFLLACFCSLVVLSGAGYYYYATGAISRRTVQNFLGVGSGEITIVNISDAALTASIDQLDTGPDDSAFSNSVDVQPLEIGGIGGIPPGRYVLEVSGNPGGDCTMLIERGDQFTLAVVPEGIAITKEGYSPDDPDELDLTTTSLCRQ